MARAVHCLLLLTIFDALVCLNASSWQVIWDSSLRQPYTPYDRSFSGSSILFHELQEHAGARVSENFVPLTELLPHIPADFVHEFSYTNHENWAPFGIQHLIPGFFAAGAEIS